MSLYVAPLLLLVMPLLLTMALHGNLLGDLRSFLRFFLRCAWACVLVFSAAVALLWVSDRFWLAVFGTGTEGGWALTLEMLSLGGAVLGFLRRQLPPAPAARLSARSL